MGCDVAVFIVCDDERVVVAIVVGVVAREHGEFLELAQSVSDTTSGVHD